MSGILNRCFIFMQTELMRNTIQYLMLFLVLTACIDSNRPAFSEDTTEKIPKITGLPFKNSDLQSLSEYKTTSANWRIVADVLVDRHMKNSISYEEGEGVLLNLPSEIEKGHLFTNFEHGDIELELDVMMPKGSNSGLYFQGRYEIQLFDSWQVEQPTHIDMGAVYQRWDNTKPQGEKGYEGYPPKLNAAKAPGLWQHLRVIFHAPIFDASGNKIQNAKFKEVWLNGQLINSNIELTGPTRASIGEDEVAKAPLMFQGDHGPVAFKNIRYKLYNRNQLSIDGLLVKEYDYRGNKFPLIDSLSVLREIKSDSLSSAIINENRVFRLLHFKGVLKVPVSGEYLFKTRFHNAGGALLIDNDTIISQNGGFSLKEPGYGLVNLQKGTYPVEFIYNKHNQWTLGFELTYEGPQIESQALTASTSIPKNITNNQPMAVVTVDDKTVTQRGFFMQGDQKHTHTMAVGSPKGVHFVYDLASGSLLAGWNGPFYDVTEMWHNRGIEQIGKPLGFSIHFNNGVQFASLKANSEDWPDHDFEESPQNYNGYELDSDGVPTFSKSLGGTTILDKIIPTSKERGLFRKITVQGTNEVWHKVAEDKSIKKLSYGTFMIGGTGYFIEFVSEGVQPVVLSTETGEELLVSLSTIGQSLEYKIIW